MEYLYFLANATLSLRIIEHIRRISYLSSASLTVIHQINGWIMRIKLANPLNSQQHGDFKAYLQELGIPYEAGARMAMIFWSLDLGDPPLQVMRHYQVAIVSHGKPNIDDIEAFREEFTRGLGYCPETLA